MPKVRKKETRKEIIHTYSADFGNGYCPYIPTTETKEEIEERCRKANAKLKFYM